MKNSRVLYLLLVLIGLSAPLASFAQIPVDSVGYFAFYDAATGDTSCVSSGVPDFVFVPDTNKVDSVRFLPAHSNNVFRQFLFTTNDTSWYRICVQILRTDSTIFEVVCDTMATPICISLAVDKIEAKAIVEREVIVVTGQAYGEDGNSMSSILEVMKPDSTWFTAKTGFAKQQDDESPYQFKYSPPTSGTYYLRIGVLDANGSAVYSNVVQATVDLSSRIQIRSNPGPNPVLFSEDPNTKVSGILIFDSMGNKVGETSAEGGLPPHLNPGLYWAKGGLRLVLTQ